VTEYDADCAACKLFGQKWMLQIVAVLLAGPRRFSAVRNAIPELSEKVLSGRLGELEAAGIVSRAQFPEIPPRVEYALTPSGLALEGVIAEMDRWSREVAPGVARSAAEAGRQEETRLGAHCRPE
jgi:DNA-binding HxlR family transcriptional regulator